MILAAVLSVAIVVTIVCGRALLWLVREIREPTFSTAGFVYAQCGTHSGWLSHDVTNNDWILWSAEDQRMYRSVEAKVWNASSENREECLSLGAQYIKAHGKPERNLYQ